MHVEGSKNWKSLLFPLIWEALFVGSYVLIAVSDDKRHFSLTLYFMFAFYFGLLVYYRRSFSFREFFRKFLDWKGFILPVLLTAVGISLAHSVSACALERLFPSTVKIVLPLAFSSNVFETVLFAFTVMVLKPFACELFFRQGWIRTDKWWLLVLTVLSGFVLEALTRSITLPGMVETVLLAIPLVIAYLITKNVYVTIFVHLVFSIIVNMPDVVYDFMRLALA